MFFSCAAKLVADRLGIPFAKSAGAFLPSKKLASPFWIIAQPLCRLLSFSLSFFGPCVATAFRKCGYLFFAPYGVFPARLHSFGLSPSLYWVYFVGIGSTTTVFVTICAQIYRAIFHPTAFAARFQMMSVKMFPEFSTIGTVAAHDGNYTDYKGHLALLFIKPGG